jgi:hypothetical protein
MMTFEQTAFNGIKQTQQLAVYKKRTAEAPANHYFATV